MKLQVRQERLLYGAFLAVALIITALYIFLEHSWAYRITSLIFLGLVTWESIRLYTLTYAKLYTLFLLACVGFYSFSHLPPILFTLGIGLLSLGSIWLANIIDKVPLGRREIIASSILFTLLVVSMANTISHSLFAKAALAMLACAGLGEMFKYRSVERWRVALSYGILTLLLLLLIFTTAALR